MTAASGTSLVLSILSLVVSLVVGVGALIMARANLHRQIQVAAREAWMREFREQVAVFLTWQFEFHRVGQAVVLDEREIGQSTQAAARMDAEISQLEQGWSSPPSPDATKRLTDLRLALSDRVTRRSQLQHRIPDLTKRITEVSEKLGLADHTIRLLIAEKGWQDTDFTQRLQELLALPAGMEDSGEVGKRSNAVHQAAAEILRRERATLSRPVSSVLTGWPRLSRFVAWSRRAPPRFRDLP